MELTTSTSIPRYLSLIQSSNNAAFSKQTPITHSWISTSATRRFRSLIFRRAFQSSHFPVTCNCLPKSSYDSSSDRIAVLLEVDGVLIDANRYGNLQAFNAAFQKLGLDCAKWTEPIYSDLSRKAAGNEERMLALYFNQIGWPTSLPTNEKETFMTSVLEEKKKGLAEFMSSKTTPLRPGVKKAIIEKLGLERMSKVEVIGKKEIEESLYGQFVLGVGKLSSLDEEIANEATKAVAAEKKRIADEVASVLKLHVELNTGTPESLQELVVALRAGSENAEVPIRNCVLVAGNLPLIAAAEVTGMPCVVLRNSLTSRVEFKSVVAVMDSFGDADLTVSRLRQKLSKFSQ